jgi:hypothetical protein
VAWCSEKRRHVELHVRQHHRPDQTGGLQREAGRIAGLLRLRIATDGDRTAADVDGPDFGDGEAAFWLSRRPGATAKPAAAFLRVWMQPISLLHILRRVVGDHVLLLVGVVAGDDGAETTTMVFSPALAAVAAPVSATSR